MVLVGVAKLTDRNVVRDHMIALFDLLPEQSCTLWKIPNPLGARATAPGVGLHGPYLISGTLDLLPAGF